MSMHKRSYLRSRESTFGVARPWFDLQQLHANILLFTPLSVLLEVCSMKSFHVFGFRLLVVSCVENKIRVSLQQGDHSIESRTIVPMNSQITFILPSALLCKCKSQCICYLDDPNDGENDDDSKCHGDNPTAVLTRNIGSIIWSFFITL